MFGHAMKNGSLSKIFLIDENEEDFLALAEEYKDDVIFVVVDSRNERHVANSRVFATGEVQPHTAYLVNVK